MEITLQDLARRMDEQSNALETFAKHMVTLAERVMKHDEAAMGGGMPPMDPNMAPGMPPPGMPPGGEMYPMGGAEAEMPPMPPMEAPPMEDPNAPPGMYDENMGGQHGYGRKGYSMNRPTAKGFTGDYETAATEEDGKWDEKDSKLKGLEAQPAGQQGGDREDESFGPGGMAYRATAGTSNKSMDDMEARMRALEQGVTIAKAAIPAVGGQVDKALIGGGGPGGDITREDQLTVLKSSWYEIGRFAEANGYFQDLKLG